MYGHQYGGSCIHVPDSYNKPSYVEASANPHWKFGSQLQFDDLSMVTKLDHYRKLGCCDYGARSVPIALDGGRPMCYRCISGPPPQLVCDQCPQQQQPSINYDAFAINRNPLLKSAMRGLTGNCSQESPVIIRKRLAGESPRQQQTLKPWQKHCRGYVGMPLKLAAQMMAERERTMKHRPTAIATNEGVETRKRRMNKVDGLLKKRRRKRNDNVPALSLPPPPSTSATTGDAMVVEHQRQSVIMANPCNSSGAVRCERMGTLPPVPIEERDIVAFTPTMDANHWLGKLLKQNVQILRRQYATPCI